MKRRLVAILAADVAGYSRMVAENEEATLRTLGIYRSTIGDMTSEHGGRVFGTAGDSVIAEFASAVQAVRAAVAIQRALQRRNADLSQGRRMEFRIGCRQVQSHDFLEGVRAVIVDKDNKPQWDPPTLAGVSEQMLEDVFAPLEEGELTFEP